MFVSKLPLVNSSKRKDLSNISWVLRRSPSWKSIWFCQRLPSQMITSTIYIVHPSESVLPNDGFTKQWGFCSLPLNQVAQYIILYRDLIQSTPSTWYHSHYPQLYVLISRSNVIVVVVQDSKTCTTEISESDIV